MHMKLKAFSLIELLCVIGIISIVVALYLGAFPKALSRAQKVSADCGVGQTNTIKMMEPGGLLDVP
jgi:prepilin-type N-terminal cleavage/methylation domain-containing protein